MNEKWNNFRDEAFERLKETATNFMQDRPKKVEEIVTPRLQDRPKKQEEYVAPRVSTMSKYGSIQNDNLNTTAADWYRSRQQDGGSWGTTSWSTGLHANRRRWWHLNANTSRLLLYGFSGFLLSLAVLYAVIMNKSKVYFFGIVFLGKLEFLKVF